MKKRLFGQLLVIGSILTFSFACQSKQSNSTSGIEDCSDEDEGVCGDGDESCNQECTKVEPAKDASDLQAETQEAIAPIVSIPNSSPENISESSQPAISELMAPEVEETLKLEAVNAIQIVAEHSSEMEESSSASQN